jgi:hypothetical protein
MNKAFNMFSVNNLNSDYIGSEISAFVGIACDST